MNINTTGITIDGKTYRNLPEQVAYNKECIEQLMAVAETSLLTYDWKVSGWLSLSDFNYYYGALPSNLQTGRRYLLVVPYYDDSNTPVTQYFAINSMTHVSGLNYIWLYSYGATVPTSITFRVIDLGPDANDNPILPDITVINHVSRTKPTSYNRTLIVPGSSWTSTANIVKFNLGQLNGGYHIQLIPADASTARYIRTYRISLETILYNYNGTNTSITFINNDGNLANAEDMNFIVLLTPVEGMTQ